MIAAIIIILGLWSLNAFTTDDRYAKTKAMFWIFEGVLLWFAFGWPLIIIMVPPYWILKDAFLNYFQLKQKGWKILTYGGNPTGDYISEALWWAYDWLVTPWYVDTQKEYVKYQHKFDNWQFKVKLTWLALNVAGYLLIRCT